MTASAAKSGRYNAPRRSRPFFVGRQILWLYLYRSWRPVVVVVVVGRPVVVVVAHVFEQHLTRLDLILSYRLTGPYCLVVR